MADRRAGPPAFRDRGEHIHLPTDAERAVIDAYFSGIDSDATRRGEYLDYLDACRDGDANAHAHRGAYGAALDDGHTNPFTAPDRHYLRNRDPGDEHRDRPGDGAAHGKAG